MATTLLARPGRNGHHLRNDAPALSPLFPVHLPILKKRDLDPKDPDPCRGCSDCCEYVSVPLIRPRGCKDFDELLWYLLHRNVWVFLDEDGDWFVQFNTPCNQLRNQRCGVYERRPSICRRYKVEECTTYGEGTGYTHLFTSPDELIDYLRRLRPKTFQRMHKYYAGKWPSTGVTRAAVGA